MVDENFCYFGDGYTARFERKKSIVREDGTRWVRFLIIPTADLVEQYNLQEDEQYNEHAKVIREYHESDVIPLREQVGLNKILIVTGFDGEETPLSRREEHLKEQIKNLERTCKSLKIGNVRMHREYRGAMNNIQETMKKSVDLINESRKGMPSPASIDLMEES